MRSKRVVSAVLLFAAVCARPARAGDDTRNEFWPEADVFVGLNDHSRLFFLASVTRANEVDYREGMLGAHVDFFVKPIARPWLRDTADVGKRRFLSFRLGYRYAQDLGSDAGSYREHRLPLEATARAYLPGRLVILNRNRFDARWVDGEWSWRYRNRSRLEREFPAWAGGSLNPYLMAELFYDSRYSAWNRQRYFVGLEWPLGKKTLLDTYYVRQNDSRSAAARVNAIGVALNLFY